MIVTTTSVTGVADPATDTTEGWKLTITYSGGHIVEDTVTAIYLVSETLAKHAGSEHGDMVRVVMEG